MRIFELPIALWPGRDLALGVVMEREVRMNTGWNLFLGNGAVPQGDITGCVITLTGSCDDSLAIFVNGIAVKDDDNLAGDDPLEFDLFDLADAIGLTLATGDLVELFTKDNVVGRWSMFPWTAELTFDDASTKTISGGEFIDANSDVAPKYRAMGAFTLGTSPGRAASSYQLLETFQRHARRGALLTNYSAAAPVIDLDGFTVALTGPDLILDEYTEFSAHAAELLVLIGSELFSVAGAELVASGTYRLAVFRARFGTWKEEHVVGADVFLFTREELLSFTHPVAMPGNELALKLARIGGGRNGDAVDVDPVGFAVTGSALLSRISNLALDGEIAAATRAVGDDFEVSWSLPDLLDIPRGWTFQTRLQIIVDEIVVLEVLADGESTEILATTIGPIINLGRLHHPRLPGGHFEQSNHQSASH